MEKQPPGETPAAGRPSRPPAGAAVLRPDVTEAIRAAVLEELAEAGYGRMSIERVARRAGVGKAAVYRRWRSKLPVVLDVVLAVAAQDLPAPDTGSLRGDLEELLAAATGALRHPLAARIVPDLLAESARSPELAEALRKALHDAQRDVVGSVVSRAAARGELPAGLDPDLALDLVAGPLYWRLVMGRTPLPDGHVERLAAATAAAFRAAAPSGPG